MSCIWLARLTNSRLKPLKGASFKELAGRQKRNAQNRDRKHEDKNCWIGPKVLEFGFVGFLSFVYGDISNNIYETLHLCDRKVPLSTSSMAEKWIKGFDMAAIHAISQVDIMKWEHWDLWVVDYLPLLYWWFILGESNESIIMCQCWWLVYSLLYRIAKRMIANLKCMQMIHEHVNTVLTCTSVDRRLLLSTDGRWTSSAKLKSFKSKMKTQLGVLNLSLDLTNTESRYCDSLLAIFIWNTTLICEERACFLC